MAKRSEVPPDNGSGLRTGGPVKRAIVGGRRSTIASSSTACCGSYAAGRGGVTCRSATGNGRVSISALRAGRGRGCGSACLRTSQPTAITPISCWTVRSCGHISRRRREKGGPVPDSGAFPRGTDYKDSYGGRYLGASPALYRDRGPAA